MAEARKPSRIPPHLVAALTCDVGVVDPSTGKKSLIGVFNAIYANGLPTSRAVSLYIKAVDGEGFYPLKIQFMRSDDERPIAEAEAEVAWRDRSNPIDLLLSFPPIPIPKHGRYEFRILMSGMYVGRAVLDVLPMPTPNAPTQ